MRAVHLSKGGPKPPWRARTPPAWCAAPAAPPAAPPPAAPPAAAPRNAPWPATQAQEEPETHRHSTGLMVLGIIAVSIGPLFLLGAVDADSRGDGSQRNVDLALGVALVGAGVPLIIVGAKQEP